jgi:predicted SprT family Zn-dependent metalloprotease
MADEATTPRKGRVIFACFIVCVVLIVRYASGSWESVLWVFGGFVLLGILLHLAILPAIYLPKLFEYPFAKVRNGISFWEYIKDANSYSSNRELTNSAVEAVRDTAKWEANNVAYAQYMEFLKSPVIATIPSLRPDQAHLQQLCHTLLSKFPGTPEPTVTVRPSTHFKVYKTGRCVAHARLGQPPLIEFNSDYLKGASEADVIDTMMHELLHHWIHVHKFGDKGAHGDRFETAAKLLGITYSHSWHENDHEDEDPLGLKDELEQLRRNR